MCPINAWRNFKDVTLTFCQWFTLYYYFFLSTTGNSWNRQDLTKRFDWQGHPSRLWLKLYGYHQKGKHRIPSVHRNEALLDGDNIWMDDHLHSFPVLYFLRKPRWLSGYQSRFPPLLQMLYVGWVSVDPNLTSRIFSGHSSFLPPQNRLLFGGYVLVWEFGFPLLPSR